jgi:hypothetical protein
MKKGVSFSGLLHSEHNRGQSEASSLDHARRPNASRASLVSVQLGFRAVFRAGSGFCGLGHRVGELAIIAVPDGTYGGVEVRLVPVQLGKSYRSAERCFLITSKC